MATLLEVHDADGSVRRCDAACHTALHPECTCICGGRFHGRRAEAERLLLEPGRLAALSAELRLRSGEAIQLRFGA